MLVARKTALQLPWWTPVLILPSLGALTALFAGTSTFADLWGAVLGALNLFVPQLVGCLLLLIAFPRFLPLSDRAIRSEIALTQLSANEFLLPQFKRRLAPWAAFYAGFMLCVIAAPFFTDKRSDMSSTSTFFVLAPLIGLFGCVEGLRIACRAKPPNRAYWLTVPLSLLACSLRPIAMLMDRLIIPSPRFRIMDGGTIVWENPEQIGQAMMAVHLQLPAIVGLLFAFLLWCSWRSLFRNYFKFE